MNNSPSKPGEIKLYPTAGIRREGHEFNLTNFEYLLTFNFNPKESHCINQKVDAEDNLAFDIVHAIEFSRTRHPPYHPKASE
ncbi:hypothetical protein, partial [Leucobacter sp. M11]|uniref:hypothetical protein n=1 Tax=Leucobacter sp. M11 TaxID=2993565 RepID=UPI002D7EA8F4